MRQGHTTHGKAERTAEDTAIQRHLSIFKEHVAGIQQKPNLAPAYQYVLNRDQVLCPDTIWKKLIGEECRSHQSDIE